MQEYVDQFLNLWDNDRCQAIPMLRNVDYSDDAEEFYTLLFQTRPIMSAILMNTDY